MTSAGVVRLTVESRLAADARAVWSGAASSVTPNPTGERPILSDELVVEPRTRLLAPAVRAGVALAFRHRHDRLRRRFGEAG